MKIHLQGEWKTGQVYLNGDALWPVARLPYLLKRPSQKLYRFSWGSDGNEAAQLAHAILYRVLGLEVANRLFDAFRRDVVSQLPQLDFRCVVDLGGWIRDKIPTKRRQSCRSI